MYRSKQLVLIVSPLLLASGIANQAAAAGVKYENGDKYVKLGGRIQLQYHREDPDQGDATDELFFRRLRPYVEGSVHKDWKGKIQIDYGKAEDENEVAIKDAYLQYKGIDNIKITVGNANFPFSREFLTSSKYQQFVERTFVGDHNFGTPDRQTGIYLDGHDENKFFNYSAGVTMAAIDPSNKKLDFDTVVNRNDDFQEGPMFGGRLEIVPLGKMKLSQGDLKQEGSNLAFGVAAFHWSNDEDNLSDTDDGGDPVTDEVDTVTGVEVDVAYRGYGISVDAEYNRFESELVDPNITEGIYENSETTLENMVVEGGYMIIPTTLEAVAGYQLQKADGYAEDWTRISFGANYFFTQNHDIKLQLTYRIGENKDGVDGKDEDELFVQTQYVF